MTNFDGVRIEDFVGGESGHFTLVIGKQNCNDQWSHSSLSQSGESYGRLFRATCCMQNQLLRMSTVIYLEHAYNQPRIDETL